MWLSQVRNLIYCQVNQSKCNRCYFHSYFLYGWDNLSIVLIAHKSNQLNRYKGSHFIVYCRTKDTKFKSRRFFAQRKARWPRNLQSSCISTQKDMNFQPFGLESSILSGSLHELKSGTSVLCFLGNHKYPESLDFQVFLPYFHHFKTFLLFTSLLPNGKCVVEFQVFPILKSKLCGWKIGGTQ